MRFRPCIDLHNGKVKQIVGATLSDRLKESLVENFVSDKDAGYYARLFKEDNLTGGHVIMLGKGNEEEAVKALKAYPGGLQAGGGITPDNASMFLDAGASHVIVTSYIFHDGRLDMDRLKYMVSTVGKNRLVIDISCRKKDGRYFVATNRWQTISDFDITRRNVAFLEEYCSELLVHAVDVEGKLKGPDEELLALLGDCVSIPATYAGGISSFDDLKKVKELGSGKIDATIGSALDIFGGHMPYKEVIKWFMEEGI